MIKTIPERARVLTLELQADSDTELANALFNLSHQVSRGEINNGCSGGYASGCIYDLRDGNCTDHESFIKRLKHYLQNRERAKDITPCARMESEAQIKDGHLVISLSISTLAHAARHSEHFFQAKEHGTPLIITNEAVFAESVCHALNREAEDGSTPISRVIDAATRHVAEQGDCGVDVEPINKDIPA